MLADLLVAQERFFFGLANSAVLSALPYDKSRLAVSLRHPPPSIGPEELCSNTTPNGREQLPFDRTADLGERLQPGGRYPPQHEYAP